MNVRRSTRKKRRRRLRFNLRKFALRVCLIVLLLAISVPVTLVLYHARQAPEEQADVLIVLGCRLYGDVPSLLLRYRLDKAIELFEAGMAQEIIVSGAMGEGETVTEAYAMKKYLVERGVRDDLIHMEEDSFNTWENLSYSQKIMNDLGYASAIIVSNDFHIFRALIIARKLDLAAKGAPSEMPTIWGMKTRYVTREIPAIYRELLFRRPRRPAAGNI